MLKISFEYGASAHWTRWVDTSTMPKKSEKAEDEGCCALQRRVDRKWWCERCLAGRWGQRCHNKALWKRLDAASMQPMRGRYLDIDRCLYAPMDDVQEMHEEYLVKQEAKTLPWE